MNPQDYTRRFWSEYGVDDMPPAKRKYAVELLAGMEFDLRYWPELKKRIIRDARAALAALRDTQDVFL